MITAEELKNLLKAQLEEYCDERKPEGLKGVDKVSFGETIDSIKQDGSAKNFFESFSTFFKGKAATISEHTRTHTPAIKFVVDEMELIIKEQYASEIKKLCDCAILLYGLIRHLRLEDSEDMLPLITLPKEFLWAGTFVGGEDSCSDQKAFTVRFSSQILKAAGLIKARAYTIMLVLDANPMEDKNDGLPVVLDRLSGAEESSEDEFSNPWGVNLG